MLQLEKILNKYDLFARRKPLFFKKSMAAELRFAELHLKKTHIISGTMSFGKTKWRRPTRTNVTTFGKNTTTLGLFAATALGTLQTLVYRGVPRQLKVFQSHLLDS